MSERNLPAKASPAGIVPSVPDPSSEVARRAATYLGRRAEAGLPLVATPGDADVPGLAGRNDLRVTNTNMQAIAAETANVTVRQEVHHYHGPVTQHITHEINYVEHTHTNLEYRSERTESRPTYIVPARGRSGEAMTSSPISLLAVFLGFIALVFVIVAGFRAVSTPTVVIVDEADETPKSFLEYMENRGR